MKVQAIFIASGMRKKVKSEKEIIEKVKSKEEIKQAVREKKGKETTSEYLSGNIKDSLNKFLKPLGCKELRDLLFDFDGGKLKYKRYVYIHDLEQKDLETLTLQGKTFDFNGEKWVRRKN